MESNSGTVLVTGASGIIGRCISRILSGNWKKVVRIVMENRWHQGMDLSAKDYVVLDLSQQGMDIRQFIGIRPDAVVHLAAAVPHSYRYPDNDQSAMLTKVIDRNIADAVAYWSCPVIYTSTCGLYERRTDRLKSEYDESVICIRSPYFAAKYEGEKVFGRLANSTILRLSAPIGPGLKRKVVLGRFLETAKAGGIISVWGSGRREQNFVDARDVAMAVGLALAKGGAGVINIAGRRAITMLELAKTVTEIVGKGRIRIGEKPDPMENEKARYDISRAQKVLGWRPTIDLRESIKWIKDEPLAD